jgi:hypothetical protein
MACGRGRLPGSRGGPFGGPAGGAGQAEWLAFNQPLPPPALPPPPVPNTSGCQKHKPRHARQRRTEAMTRATKSASAPGEPPLRMAAL